MKPMYPAVVNSPVTELAAAIDDVQVTISVTDISALPPAPNLAVLGTDETAETIRYTSINGSELTVERGFQGNARAWSAGTKIARNYTEYDHEAFRENIEEHVADEVRHVTAEKQASWDAKETPKGAQEKADAAAAASVPRVGDAAKSGRLNVTADADIINMSGTTHAFSTYSVGGTRKGYVGVSDPQRPMDMVIASDMGNVNLFGQPNGLFYNGYNIVNEIETAKQSGVSAKQAVVDAINAQGGQASTEDDWATLAAKIRAITRGLANVYLLRNSEYYLWELEGKVPIFRNNWIQGYVENNRPGEIFPNSEVIIRPELGDVILTSGENKRAGRAQAITQTAVDLTNVKMIEFVFWKPSDFESPGFEIMWGVMANYNVSGIFYDRYKSFNFRTYPGNKQHTVTLDVSDLSGMYYIGVDKKGVEGSYTGSVYVYGVRLIQNP
ncbi:hypothetical protein [Paenibacillus apiarius]|uniref:hypothetical protein n=1 Tax=Paenibacillus apiarius TaxID=46240 RepID=UPI003B3B9B04